MIISREWAMPDAMTFRIKPIKKLILRHIGSNNVIVDPFARDSKFGTITNDLNPETDAMFHMDALDFLKTLDDESADVVLFDPPYSPRQVSECYKQAGISVNFETTQASFWRNLKVEISRITKPDGRAISFGWNSGGIGMKYGFELHEVLLVAHGGAHNDTICTAEKKATERQLEL